MYHQLNRALLSVVTLLLPAICVAVTPGDLKGPMQFFMWVFGAFVYMIVIPIITAHVLFLMNISKLLKSCDEHATMPSSLVWLNLIPIFNFAWMIYTVLKVSESIERAFKANGSQDINKGAKVAGLIYSISVAIAPFSNFVIAVIALVFWIVYWDKISGYSYSLSVMQAQVPSTQAPHHEES